MGFTKKTWKNRIAEYINRRLITMEDGSTNLVTVARDEGTISQEGDAFNAANMNNLEDRIEAGFEEINQRLAAKYTNLTSGTSSWKVLNAFAQKNNNIYEYEAHLTSNTLSNQIYLNGFSLPNGIIQKHCLVFDETNSHVLIGRVSPSGNGIKIELPNIPKDTSVLICDQLFLK